MTLGKITVWWFVLSKNNLWDAVFPKQRWSRLKQVFLTYLNCLCCAGVFIITCGEFRDRFIYSLTAIMMHQTVKYTSLLLLLLRNSPVNVTQSVFLLIAHSWCQMFGKIKIFINEVVSTIGKVSRMTLKWNDLEFSLWMCCRWVPF